MRNLHTNKVRQVAIVAYLEALGDSAPEILDEIVLSARNYIVHPLNEAPYEFA